MGLATACCNFAVSCPQALFYRRENSITQEHISHADSACFYLYLRVCDFLNSKCTVNEIPGQIRVKINAFLTILADISADCAALCVASRMINNSITLTRIRHLGLNIWRGRLISKTVKYSVEDIVKKIKMAYGLIKGIVGCHIHIFCLLTRPLNTIMAIIRLGLKRASAPLSVPPRSHRIPQSYAKRRSSFCRIPVWCSGFCSKLRAPHRALCWANNHNCHSKLANCRHVFENRRSRFKSNLEPFERLGRVY